MMQDAFLRGGAAALLLLLACTGLRDARRVPADRYAVLFDVCALAYLVESAPALHGSHAPWLAPVRLLSTATPAVFALWAAATFSDSFVPRWWRWLPFALMLALGGWALATDWPLAWRVTQAVAMLLVARGLYHTLSGREGDLVETRRWLRLALAGGIGAWIVVDTVVGALGAPGVPSVAGVFALAMTAALLRLGTERPAAAVPVRAPVPAVAGGMDDEELRLRERLRVAMDEERVYREGGLTVAVLAERLGVPEYRLRRLINQRLGHRNFASFVNGYRLAESMAALADPAQARVPVLTIALDAGFQSIGPFNRAFKAQTGETPTDYRRARVG